MSPLYHYVPESVSFITISTPLSLTEGLVAESFPQVSSSLDHMKCVLEVLILSPTHLAVSFILAVFCCICASVDDNRATSSAKSRSSSFVVKCHLIPLSPFPVVFLIMKSITDKKRKPDMLHPFHTKTITHITLVNDCTFEIFIEKFKERFESAFALEIVSV